MQSSSSVVPAQGSPSSMPPEYVMGIEYFHQLCEDFSQPLTFQQGQDLRVFMMAVACIDRHLDVLADDADADLMIDHICHFLQQSPDMPSIGKTVLDDEMICCLQDFRDILFRLGSLTPFLVSLKEMHRFSRKLRVAKDVGSFIDLSLREGELAGRMALMSFDSRDFSPALVSFVIQGVALLNLRDNFLDCDQDFLDSTISIRPGLVFKARLQTALVARGALLFAHYPNKSRAVSEITYLTLRKVRGELESV